MARQGGEIGCHLATPPAYNYAHGCSTALLEAEIIVLALVVVDNVGSGDAIQANDAGDNGHGGR